MSFVNELKRRNVLRVGAAYVVAAWLAIQVVETLFPVYGLSDASVRIVITILAIGLIHAGVKVQGNLRGSASTKPAF